jgi:hypothetical protein
MAQPQPVITYDAAKLGISAIVTWVWAAVPDPVVQIIATVAGVLLYGGLTWFTQHVVTPLSSPQDADGVPLVPADAEVQALLEQRRGRHEAVEPPAPGA